MEVASSFFYSIFYSILSSISHQKPSRSLWLFGSPMGTTVSIRVDYEATISGNAASGTYSASPNGDWEVSSMMGLVSKWYWVGFVGGAYLLVGCAAAQIALEHKDLDVQTQASATIFLAPAQPEKKTVWIDIKSTADREVDLSALRGLIASRGYRVVQDPNEANYWLQANVLYVGNAALSAIRDSVYAGWGGAMGGAAVGGFAGTLRGAAGELPLACWVVASSVGRPNWSPARWSRRSLGVRSPMCSSLSG